MYVHNNYIRDEILIFARTFQSRDNKNTFTGSEPAHSLDRKHTKSL